MRTHLPWFAAPDTACFSCHGQFARADTLEKHCALSACGEKGRFGPERLTQWCETMTAFMMFLAAALGLRSYSDLVPFVSVRYLYPTQHPGFINTDLMTALAHFMRLPAPDVWHVSPPNHVAALAHPRILGELVAVLPDTLWPEAFAFRMGGMMARISGPTLPPAARVGHSTDPAPAAGVCHSTDPIFLFQYEDEQGFLYLYSVYPDTDLKEIAVNLCAELGYEDRMARALEDFLKARVREFGVLV